MHRLRNLVVAVSVAVLITAGAARANDIIVPNYTSESVSIIDGTTGGLVRTVPVPSGPWNVVVSPNGKTAYVVQWDANSVVALNLSNDALGTPIALLPSSTIGNADQMAIAPDGKMLYVLTSKGITPVNLTSGTAGTFVPTSNGTVGLAITPNGETAYVTNEDISDVIPIDLADNVPGTPIPIPSPIMDATTPNGQQVWVQTRNGNVYPINPTTNAVGTSIPVTSANPFGLAISPDGRTAWADEYSDHQLIPVTLATGTVGAPIPVGIDPEYPFLSPDGKTVYSANFTSDNLSQISTSTLTVGAPISTGQGPGQAAFVPNQGPKARFSDKVKGSKVHFNASKSSAAGGVALYKWNFGDGKKKSTKRAKITHRYRHHGRHKVTLTVVDHSGCSTQVVYGGQDIYCNGTKAARVTHKVKTNAKK